MEQRIPVEAVQKAIHMAYLAGKHGSEEPRFLWIPPKDATCDPAGNWITIYPGEDAA